MTIRMRQGARPLLIIAGWLIAASGATAFGVLAVGAVGASVVGRTTSALSQEQVEQALNRTSRSPSLQTTTTAPVTSPGVNRVLATPGGTVIARCVNGDAALLSWSPAQGYDAEEIHPGPAPTASLIFEAEGTERQVRVRCAAGVPTATTITRADHDSDND